MRESHTEQPFILLLVVDLAVSRVAEVLESELIRLLKQAQEETGKRRTSILLDLLVNLSNPVEPSIRGT